MTACLELLLWRYKGAVRVFFIKICFSFSGSSRSCHHSLWGHSDLSVPPRWGGRGWWPVQWWFWCEQGEQSETERYESLCLHALKLCRKFCFPQSFGFQPGCSLVLHSTWNLCFHRGKQGYSPVSKGFVLVNYCCYSVGLSRDLNMVCQMLLL